MLTAISALRRGSPNIRLFSTTSTCFGRAVIYKKNGNPAEVLSVISYPDLPKPPSQTANIRFLLSPINPADINVVEGVYPSKPLPNKSIADDPVFIGGNEGLAEVTAVGEGSPFHKGDWVIMDRPQMGTWCSEQNVNVDHILKLPRVVELSQVYGATFMVNFPTAYNMLNNFISLSPGDWVVQNGGNSAVGQAVIQIAAAQGLKTINFVRNRDNLADLVQQLEELGATKVFTYDDLSNKSFRSKVKEITGGHDIRLGLNCVGGKETSLMAGLLGTDAKLVSYGAMSKQPLSLPTSLFIFKNLTSHGFWQTRWNEIADRAQKESLTNKLVGLISEGKLKEPGHEIVSIPAGQSDEEAGSLVRNVFAQMAQGKYGKKVLLKFE